MRRFVRQNQHRNASRPTVCHAWITTTILVTSGFFWSLIQLFTTLTMECRIYYDWVADAAAGYFNTLEAMVSLSLAMATYLLADILRPKRKKRSLPIRFVQLLLVFSVVSASFINYGIIMPDSRIAPLARQIESGFAYAGLGAFVYPELEYGMDPFWIPQNPTPTFNTSAYALYSPFAIKAGLLRCEVDAQVRTLQDEQGAAHLNSAIPFAITEERL